MYITWSYNKLKSCKIEWVCMSSYTQHQISHRVKTDHLFSCYRNMFHWIISDSVIRRWGLKKRHFSLLFLHVCGYGSTSFDKITLRRVIKNTISGNPDPHSFSCATSHCPQVAVSLKGFPYAIPAHPIAKVSTFPTSSSTPWVTCIIS